MSAAAPREGRDIVPLATFEYHPRQFERFRNGGLWREWAHRHPQVIDERDVALARTQAHLGYHFHEWFAAICIHEATGYRSLIGKYAFGNHPGKRALVRTLVGAGFDELLCRRGGPQPPDLLVYSGTDWYLCEVKGPNDRLRAEQRTYFGELAAESGKPVRMVKLKVNPRLAT